VPPRPRILVVEDDASLRKLLQLRLSMAGFEVVTAEDGQVGLDILEEVNPRLAVCDLMMPRVNGATFCRAARRREGFEKLPIVLLTARQLDADIEELLEMGHIVYMGKPFDAHDLCTLLREMLCVEVPAA
jgi:DNA-binding response OmpR family regulator